MHMRLKSLAVKTKEPKPSKISEATPERVPEVELNTKMEGISGLSGCKVGDKYRLVFDAEVKALRSPKEWEIEHGFKKTDLFLTFTLNKGGIEPKSIAEAATRMKESGDKY